MDLYPAIDLRDGKCVRLLRGDFDAETIYDDNPAAVAKRFEASGAKWIHVVDLDAARTGSMTNLGSVAAICQAVGCSVEVGGGVRSIDAADALIDAGVARVIVGTAAIEEPSLVVELCERHPGQVAVGLDTRQGIVAVRGWVAESQGHALLDALESFARVGVAAFIVTAIERDGTLEGPDISQLRSVLGATDTPVIASGGVGTLDDLRLLASTQVAGRAFAGAIAGKALYEGRFTVEEGIAACSLHE